MNAAPPLNQVSCIISKFQHRAFSPFQQVDAGPHLPQCIKPPEEGKDYYWGRGVREAPDPEATSRAMGSTDLPCVNVVRERVPAETYIEHARAVSRGDPHSSAPPPPPLPAAEGQQPQLAIADGAPPLTGADFLGPDPGPDDWKPQPQAPSSAPPLAWAVQQAFEMCGPLPDEQAYRAAVPPRQRRRPAIVPARAGRGRGAAASSHWEQDWWEEEGEWWSSQPWDSDWWWQSGWSERG